MQKTIILSLTATLILATTANARYKYPDDVPSPYERQAIRLIEVRDKNRDSKLSPEEYSTFSSTRYEQNEIKRSKEKGTYIEPSNEFKLIDADEDGYLSLEEIAEYYRKQHEGK